MLVDKLLQTLTRDGAKDLFLDWHCINVPEDFIWRIAKARMISDLGQL